MEPFVVYRIRIVARSADMCKFYRYLEGIDSTIRSVWGSYVEVVPKLPAASSFIPPSISVHDMDDLIYRLRYPGVYRGRPFQLGHFVPMAPLPFPIQTYDPALNGRQRQWYIKATRRTNAG